MRWGRFVAVTLAGSVMWTGGLVGLPEAEAGVTTKNRVVCKAKAVNVRSGATTSSRRVGTLPSGTAVSGTQRGRWFRLTAGPHKGKYISYAYTCAKTPAATSLSAQLANSLRGKKKAAYDKGQLDPEFAKRFAAAVAAGKKAGYRVTHSTAYRTWDHQWSLYRSGVLRRGSVAKARAWVLPPWQSMHVRGLAVDVNNPAAAAWLHRTNGAHGLCRRYVNEPWHFEMLGPLGTPCPRMEPNASKGNP